MEVTEEIISKCKQRDKQSFALFYKMTVDRLWSFVYLQTNHREDSNDVVAEAYLDLWAHIDQIVSVKPSSMIAYLYTIARNKIKLVYKNRSNHVRQDIGDFVEADITPIQSTDKLVDKVQSILAKLPPNYAEILRLRFLAGLTIAESAATMGMTINSIKVLQHRAIAKSRQIYLS